MSWRIKITPRILNDVSVPDTRTSLLGKEVKAPIVIAPMGSCMLAWPNADIAIARAAAALDIALIDHLILTTDAVYSMRAGGLL